jgi:hypothetical protein
MFLCPSTNPQKGVSTSPVFMFSHMTFGVPGRGEGIPDFCRLIALIVDLARHVSILGRDRLTQIHPRNLRGRAGGGHERPASAASCRWSWRRHRRPPLCFGGGEFESIRFSSLEFVAGRIGSVSVTGWAPV